MSLIGRIVSAVDRDPIILSHHPLCGRFEDHFFKVRGRRVCRGCVTVYPSAIVTAVLLWAVGPGSFWVTFAIASSFFAVNLLRLLIKGHRLSTVFNASLGISLGACLFSAFYAPEDLRLVVVCAGLAVAIAFSFLKGHRVFAECKSCERYGEFPSCCCPGSHRADGDHQPRVG